METAVWRRENIMLSVLRILGQLLALKYVLSSVLIIIIILMIKYVSNIFVELSFKDLKLGH